MRGVIEKRAKVLAVSAAICLVAAVGCLSPMQKGRAAPDVRASVRKAIDYLKARQQGDGGFAEPGGNSSVGLTLWSVCALASCGEDPLSCRKNGNSPLDFITRNLAEIKKLTEVELCCIAAYAALPNPTAAQAGYFVTIIKQSISEDGQIGGLINEHIWGMIALSAAGESIREDSIQWLLKRQNIDGGFGYSENSGSDPDDTAAAVQALIASGVSPEHNAIKRALGYLKFCQTEDGGFSWQSSSSNVASTAWVVQALIAAGEDVNSAKWRASGVSPVEYLLSMQEADGHFMHTEGADTNPAWMTAQVIPALAGRPFPLRRTDTGTDEGATRGTDKTEYNIAGEADSKPDASEKENPGNLDESKPGAAETGRKNSSSSEGGFSDEDDHRKAVALSEVSNPGGGGRKAGGGTLAFLLALGAYLVLLLLAYTIAALILE